MLSTATTLSMMNGPLGTPILKQPQLDPLIFCLIKISLDAHLIRISLVHTRFGDLEKITFMESINLMENNKIQTLIGFCLSAVFL